MTATQRRPPLPGTRPEGARDEREAAAHVREMFTRMVPRYDFLNRVISFSLDQVWRRRTAKSFLHILRRPDARILDLCCGTGDLALALDRLRASAPGGMPSARAAIIGSDFVEPMLTRAHEKARSGTRAVVFTAADALQLPFPDATFDLLTAAFGFRNLANYEKGLREFARVLKRGGEVGILDFTEPTSGPMAGPFLFYFRHILPRIGGVVSGNLADYAYLPKSVSKFPSPPELAVMMERTGFEHVRFVSLSFGSIILHSARRK